MWLPLELKFIDGKLYIIGLPSELSQYNYMEITQINNVPIATLISEMEHIISYSTIGWLNTNMEIEFTKLSTLISLPSFSDEQRIESISLEKDGKPTKLSVSELLKYQHKSVGYPNYSFEFDDESKTLILRYNSCKENRPNEMLEFVEQIERFANEKGITKFIVDIRGNHGGNSEIIKPLINYLKTNATKVITLIDERVFSSGSIAASQLRSIGSQFIGTEIGTTLNCFGETIYFVLPNTGLSANCSTKYYYFDEENNRISSTDKKRFREFLNDDNNHKYFIPQHFLPDITISKSISDFENGVDPVMTRALEESLEYESTI